MTAPQVRTPGGSRASAEELGNSDAIVPPTTPGDKPDDASGLDQCDDDRKGLARLKACAAIAGIQVHDLADGGLLVCRWGLSRAVPDVRALALFLAQLGVRT